jgi:hypothetical protein
MSVNGISKEEITEDASYFNHTIVKVVQGPENVEIYFLDNDNTLKLSIWNKNSNTDMNTRLATQLRKIREARANEYMRTADDAVKFRNKTTNESALKVKDDYLKSVLDETKEIEVLKEGEFIKLTRKKIMNDLAASIASMTTELKTATDEEKKKILENLEKAKNKQDAIFKNRMVLEQEQLRNLEEKSNFKKLDDDPLIGDESHYTKISATITIVEITDTMDPDILVKLQSVAKTKINTIIQSTLDRYTHYVEHYTMLSELLPSLQKKRDNLPKTQSLDRRDQALLTFLEKRLPELINRSNSTAPDYMKTWEEAITETETTFYKIEKIKPEEIKPEEIKPKTRLKNKLADGGNKTYSEDLVTNVLLSTAYILGVENSKSLNKSTPALVINNNNATIHNIRTADKKQRLRVTLGTTDSTLLVDDTIDAALKKDTEFLRKKRNERGEIIVEKRNIDQTVFFSKKLYSWNKLNYEEFEEHLWRTSRAMYIYTVTVGARQIFTSTNVRNTMSLYGKRILVGLIMALLFSGGLLYADVQYAPKSALKVVGEAVDVDVSTYVPVFYQVSCYDPVLKHIPFVESDFTKGLKLDCQHYFLNSEINAVNVELETKDDELATINANLAPVNGELAEVEVKLATVDAQLKELTTKREGLTEDKLNDLISKEVLLDEQRETLSEERAKLIKQKVSYTEEKSKAEQKGTVLKEKREDLISKYTDNSLQLVNIRNPNGAVVFKNNIERIQTKLKEEIAKRVKLEPVIDALTTTVVSLRAKVDVVEESKAILVTTVGELAETTKKLEEANKQVKMLSAKRLAYLNRGIHIQIYEYTLEPVVEFAKAKFYSIMEGPVASCERALQNAEKNLEHAIITGQSTIKLRINVKIEASQLALIRIEELEKNLNPMEEDKIKNLVREKIGIELKADITLPELKATVHETLVKQRSEFDETTVSEAGGCVIS